MSAIDFAQRPLLTSKYAELEPFEPVVKNEKETVPWQIRHAFKGHCVTWMLLLSILVAAFVAGILIVMPLVDRANDIASQAEDLMRVVEADILNETAKVSKLIDQFSYDYNKILVDFRSALTDVQQQINVITAEVTSIEIQQEINEAFDSIGNLVPALISPSCVDVCTDLTSTCAADFTTGASFCQCRQGYGGDGEVDGNLGCDVCAPGFNYEQEPITKKYLCTPCEAGTFKKETGYVFTISDNLCNDHTTIDYERVDGNWVQVPRRYSFLLNTAQQPIYFNDRPVYASLRDETDHARESHLYIYYYTTSPSGAQVYKWLLSDYYDPSTIEGRTQMRGSYAHSAGNSQTLPSFGWYEYCSGEWRKSNLNMIDAGCQACPGGLTSLPGSDNADDCTNSVANV